MSRHLLLIGINARYTHSNLAIRYLREIISELNFSTNIAEYSINQPTWEIMQNIYRRQPQVIAFSVYIWNAELIRQLIPDLKKILPDCRLIVGGPEVSYNAAEWLHTLPEIDFLIKGHGEAGFRFLAENDFIWQEREIFQPNPPFSELPFPYSEADFPALEHKYIYYESSRGCSFRCSYCLSSRSDQKLEFRNLEQVKSELEWLLARQPKIIKFVDRTFNIKVDFAREIWRFLIEKETATKFHFEIHPELLDEADFEILQNCPAERFQFEIGIQSTSPRTLQEIHRSQNWEKIRSNLAKLKNIGTIHLHTDLIAGLPFEGRQNLIESFNDIISLSADHFQLGFLKVLPGTEMYEKSAEYRLLFQQHPPYRILANKWLSADDLLEFSRIEKLVDLLINSEKFQITSARLISNAATPFQFFRHLLHFADSQDFDPNQHDWQNVAKLLWEFVKIDDPQNSEFYLDCLRWDWCQIAVGHFYPAFLAGNETKEWKAEGFEKLKSKDEKVISSSQLNRTIFFRPHTANFCRILKLNESVYAFIPNDKNKMRLEI